MENVFLLAGWTISVASTCLQHYRADAAATLSMRELGLMFKTIANKIRSEWVSGHRSQLGPDAAGSTAPVTLDGLRRNNIFLT